MRFRYSIHLWPVSRTIKIRSSFHDKKVMNEIDITVPVFFFRKKRTSQVHYVSQSEKSSSTLLFYFFFNYKKDESDVTVCMLCQLDLRIWVVTLHCIRSCGVMISILNVGVQKHRARTRKVCAYSGVGCLQW